MARCAHILARKRKCGAVVLHRRLSDGSGGGGRRIASDVAVLGQPVDRAFQHAPHGIVRHHTACKTPGVKLLCAEVCSLVHEELEVLRDAREAAHINRLGARDTREWRR